MDTAELLPQVEALAENIDDLEEALGPLLQAALSAHASKLPLLDRAKLYTLVTYAIESILFSYLSLNGVKAKEHAVFTELSRVRRYFQKIKQVEEAPIKPNQSLDKAAANRFIKAGLAGNDQYDKERALRQAKERAAASIKLDQLNRKRKSERTEESKVPESSDSSSSESVEEQETEGPKPKKSKRAKASDTWSADAPGKKNKKRSKNSSKEINAEGGEMEAEEAEADEDGENIEDVDKASDTRRQKSNYVPLGHKAAFQALLKGPIPKREEAQSGKRKGKGRKKSKA